MLFQAEKFITTIRLNKAQSWLQPFSAEKLIRVGSKYDGGYVVPKDKIKEIDGLLSFGIGRNWEFESALGQMRPSIPIHGYDYSVSERLFYRELRSEWLRFLTFRTCWKALQNKRELLCSFKKTFSGQNVHFRQKISKRSYGNDEAEIHTAFQRLPKSNNILLKMDIEGEEYHVLPFILSFFSKVSVLIIEFHYTGVFRETFMSLFRQLQTKFYLAHLHGNNAGELAADNVPEFLELTFVRGRPPSNKKIKILPLTGIDRPNDPNKKDLRIIWP